MGVHYAFNPKVALQAAIRSLRLLEYGPVCSSQPSHSYRPSAERGFTIYSATSSTAITSC